MAPRTKLAAAAGAVTAAALVLTACGGGGHDDKIASSHTPTSTAAATTTATVTAKDPKEPTFDFPSDVKVVIDADATGDATKDAVLRDQAYGEQALFLAIAKLDPTLPVFRKYLTDKALGDWTNKIKWGQSHHESITGTVRFYDRTVTISGPDSAGVSLCQSERNSYGKNTRTGEAIKTTPSLDDFTFHLVSMHKGTDGIWHMTADRSQERATRCAR